MDRRLVKATWLLCWLTLAAARRLACQEVRCFRDLPDHYVPGRTMTVTLKVMPRRTDCGLTFFAEKIPPRWTLVDIQYPMAVSSQGTIRWLWCVPPDTVVEVWPPGSVWYTVNPPPDARGEVVFTGEF